MPVAMRSVLPAITADLFDDDNVTAEENIISIENAKIGTLTDAQLAHHRYDWDNGQVIREAEGENYGVIRYACLDCTNYMSNTSSHPNSFDCAGIYVYAPAVALAFDANTTDPVTNLPDTRQVVYSTSGTEPSVVPVRSGYHFDGWYTTPDCTTPFDFSTILTENVTAYAKWTTEPVVIPPDTPDPTPPPIPHLTPRIPPTSPMRMCLRVRPQDRRREPAVCGSGRCVRSGLGGYLPAGPEEAGRGVSFRLCKATYTVQAPRYEPGRLVLPAEGFCVWGWLDVISLPCKRERQANKFACRSCCILTCYWFPRYTRRAHSRKRT